MKFQMHELHISAGDVSRMGLTDWWAPTFVELGEISCRLMGARTDGWIRLGDHHVVVAALKPGAKANKIEDELTDLANETRKIRAPGGAAAALRAATFFHLRFENIHPLIDGNGRVGRFILVAQLHQAGVISPEDLSEQLNAHANDYMMAFPSNDPAVMFELLLDVLARITGHIMDEEAGKLPASISPLFLDRRPMTKIGPTSIRSAAPQRIQPNPFFRKFR